MDIGYCYRGGGVVDRLRNQCLEGTQTQHRRDGPSRIQSLEVECVEFKRRRNGIADKIEAEELYKEDKHDALLRGNEVISHSR